MHFRRGIPYVVCLIAFLGAKLAVAQSDYPCGHPMAKFNRSNSDKSPNSTFNYPVILYDARTRTAILSFKNEVRNRTNPTLEPPFNRPVSSEGLPIADFLCWNRPVEVYIVNRRIGTDFTVGLTGTFAVPTGLAEFAGTTPPPASTATSNAPSPTPAAKGLQPLAAGGNLLTTQGAINNFLNDETFDVALSTVLDHASMVEAQTRQFQASYNDYDDLLDRIAGADHGAGPGNASLVGTAAAFSALTGQINANAADEETFKFWTARIGLLKSDVTAINAKIQNNQVADGVVNLRASAAVLRDNVRGIATEFNSILLAKKILLNMMGQDWLKKNQKPAAKSKAADEDRSSEEDTDYVLCHNEDFLNAPLPDYLQQRSISEVRVMLRAQYPGTTTVDDATLARIMDLYKSPMKGLALKRRLCGIDPNTAFVRFIHNVNLALTSPHLPDYNNSMCGPAAPCVKAGEGLTPGGDIDLEYSLDQIAVRLDHLRDLIKALNTSEAATIAAMNNIYDNSFAPRVVRTLDLSSYGKNLFVYYSVTGTEQFTRYQIIGEVPQPQSNCANTITANTSTSGGANACTAAQAQTLPAPQLAGGWNAPAAAAAPAPSPSGGSGNGANQTASNNPAPTPSGGSLPDFYGHFELHAFDWAGLFTGVAWDSVANNSFSWYTCPTNPSDPNGSFTKTMCVSPTTPPGATTPAPTYYQLLLTKQPQVAAIEGISLYPWAPKDSFAYDSGSPWHRFLPGLFIAGSAYPLNHYFGGASFEPVRGVSLIGGFVSGAQTVLPHDFPYIPGAVVQSQTTIVTSTAQHPGYFIGFAFHTSLFGAIFNGSAFSNVLNIGTAGSPAPSPATSTGSSH